MNKPRLSFLAIWNMSFGFFGIQFGWGLQMANMSSIYQYLGAKPEELALLWLAAPLTGLILQPIIGYYSDRTWNGLGRRRPYFLGGALCASGALILMPNSSALWMAVGLLWILDASVNLSMEPFRAFVADKLPQEQHSIGFATQSVLIGFGAVVSSSLPWMLMNWCGMSSDAGEGSSIPGAVHWAFYIGAGVFLSAVLYTILSTPEYPPDDIEAFRRQNAATSGPLRAFKEIFHGVRTMPKTMRQLAVVQFFTWLALFSMWIYFGTGIAGKIFHGAPGTARYTEGVAWGGVCFSAYNGIAFVFAFALLWLVHRFRAKDIHTFCLVAGGLGLASVPFISRPDLLLVAMAGVGIAWASILAMPYAMLAASLPPDKTGFYMGVFNFFIVIPQIVMSVFLGSAIVKLSGGNQLAPVFVGGLSLFLAAALTRFVDDPSVRS
ncbi:MAG: MFS transporter [Verrucomicrobiae bacterium]